MKDLHTRTIRAGMRGFVVLAGLIFLTAGTFRYWQGWSFLATFTVCSTALNWITLSYRSSIETH